MSKYHVLNRLKLNNIIFTKKFFNEFIMSQFLTKVIQKAPYVYVLSLVYTIF